MPSSLHATNSALSVLTSSNFPSTDFKAYLTFIQGLLKGLKLVSRLVLGAHMCLVVVPSSRRAWVLGARGAWDAPLHRSTVHAFMVLGIAQNGMQ
jgi:hypothetical protein